MTKNARRAIFYALILIFILAGTFIILFAEGWRFDLETFKTNKVGAIYIRSYPESANYYLDGKPVSKDFGLIFNVGTFINGLFPDTYNLDVTLPNFHPIHRTLTVEPSMVTTAEHLVMVPEDSKLLSDGPLSDFWLIGNEVLTKTDKGLIWRNKTVSGASVVGWTDDDSKLLTNDPKGNYFWVDLATGSSTNITASLRRLGYQPKEISVDPQNSSDILASFSRMAASYNPSLKQLSPISASSTPLNMAASRFWLSWSNYDEKADISSIVIADRSTRTIHLPITRLDGKTVKIAWTKNDRLAVLQNDGSLYMFSSDLNSADRLASDATDFTFTDDASKVAVLEKSALEVFSFRKDELPNYWRFGIQDAKDIKTMSWFKDMHHLFISHKDAVYFLDLDDRRQESLIKMADTERSEYNLDQNGLYYLNQGKLYTMDLPS